jgi:hypothetical protein
MDGQQKMTMEGSQTSEASPVLIGESPDISLKTPTEASLVDESGFVSGK